MELCHNRWNKEWGKHTFLPPTGLKDHQDHLPPPQPDSTKMFAVGGRRDVLPEHPRAFFLVPCLLSDHQVGHFEPIKILLSILFVEIKHIYSTMCEP